MMSWLGTLLALGILTPFVLSYLTQCPFRPHYFPPSLSINAFHESLGDLRVSQPSFDPYCVYLEDVPAEIMWSTFSVMLLIFVWHLMSLRGH